MYKLVIIDDESLFRKNMIKKINWHSCNISVVGEADNGQEGFNLIKSLNPDIVICDIKMPVWDGLTVLKNLKNIGNMRFIILSGYNDFEFTKKAIRYGAFDYILKPVKEEELTGVLMRAVSSLNTDIKKQNNKIKYDIQVRKKMVDRYESLFIHFTESREITSICKYIDIFYEELDAVHHPQVYNATLMEFILLADKICDMFKLDYDCIFNKYKLDSLLNDDNKGNHALPQIVKKIFTEIISQLISTKNCEGKKIVFEVIQYIETDYSEKITLETISKRYFINPSYFSQLFKSIVKENFSTYLMKKRIEKAKELLYIGNLKIYQVSHMVGYDDDKYFSQIFKKHTGVSPSNYAKSLTNS